MNRKFGLVQNKKGDVFQILFILILLFIVAIIGLILLKFTNQVNTYMSDSGLINQSQLASKSHDIISQTAPYTTDYAVFFLFLGSIVALCIGAVRTNFSPTIIFLFLLLMLFTVFVSAGLVNVYHGFAEQLPTETASLPLTNFLFSRYTPLIMAVVGGIVLLIMYSKQGSEIVT